MPVRQRAKPSSPSPHAGDPRPSPSGEGEARAGVFDAARESDNSRLSALCKLASEIGQRVRAVERALQVTPSLSQAVAPERVAGLHRKPDIRTKSELALSALLHSLGESPRLSPSLEQVRLTLASAAELIRRRGYSYPAFLDVLADAGTPIHQTAHWHARRFLSALAGVVNIANDRPETGREALSLLRRGERLLFAQRPKESGGWRIAAGRIEAPRAKAAKSARERRPVQLSLFSWSPK